MIRTTADLECFDCLDECEAKGVLENTYDLVHAGFQVNKASFYCPKRDWQIDIDLTQQSRE